MSFKSKISEIYKINEPVGFYFTFISMMMICLGFIIAIPGVYSIIEIAKDCSQGS